MLRMGRWMVCSSVFRGLRNPDLAKKLEEGKALEGNIDFATLYGRGGSEANEKKGYVDYPVATF